MMRNAVPSDPATVRAEVEREAEVFRLCRRTQVACFTASCLMLMSSVICIAVFGEATATPLFLLTLFFTVTAMVRIHLLTMRGEAAVQRMVRKKDPEAIGAYIDLLEHTEIQVHSLAGQVLTDLLPGLRASDSERIDDRRRTILNRVLRIRNIPTDHRLILAILRTWEQIGDENALETVERLSRIFAYSSKAREIREAARACLPALEVRVAQDRLRTRLLRPATDPGTPSETLLRPATTTPDSEHAVLLRPVGPEDSTR